MKTHVYIDGYNLYYRAVRNTRFKWLDLQKLAEMLFPEDTIRKICYFTAQISARPDDPNRPHRQQIYLRALKTIPTFEVFYGTFQSSTKRRPLAEPEQGSPSHVLIKDWEEKGSDVNLVTRLLVDGFNKEYEQAVVVSNDGDFASALRYVKEGLHLRVTLVNPDYKRASAKKLADAATYVKHLRKSHLRQCQFPDTLTDAKGLIRKPTGW